MGQTIYSLTTSESKLDPCGQNTSNILKGEIIDFLQSFDEVYEIKDENLKNSLILLSSVLERYFLFGKPRNYLLKNWEVNECLNPTVYDRRVYKNIISLEPYFISFLRDNKLKILCKQENLDHTMV